MATPPRVVMVTRPTVLDRLIASHGTLGQARFFLKSRGQDVDGLIASHTRQAEALNEIRSGLPTDWRSGHIDRGVLDRFVFEPNDIIVAVGQDGLVANVAKYLTTQRIVGVNPEPDRYEGVLVLHAVGSTLDVLHAAVASKGNLEERTMVEARTDDGQRLRALNEIFVGHQSHQSARYRIAMDGREERQSSSGLIVSTGTGATGWTRSIHQQRRSKMELPSPIQPRLAFFVREAWPSVSTAAGITEGVLQNDASLEVTSEMNDGGVLFGDGIESDRIEFRFGARVRIQCSATRLRLIT